MNPRIVAALIVSLAPATALPSVLYKSIGPNGVVEFSDVPPADRSRVVEQRPLPSRTEAAVADNGQPLAGNLDGLPYVIEDANGALERANAQLDLAEHALAEALRSLGSPLQDMRLKGHAVAVAGSARIDFFRRNVQAARQNLMDVLRARATALAQARPQTLASR